MVKKHKPKPHLILIQNGAHQQFCILRDRWQLCLHQTWCTELEEAWLQLPYVTRLAVEPPEGFTLHQ